MPSVQRKQRAYRRNYYLYNAEKMKAVARSLSRDIYSSNPERKKALAKHYYSLSPEKKKALVKDLYIADPNKKRGAVKRLYDADPDKKRGAVKRLYDADPDKKRGAVKRLYDTNPDKKRGAVKRLYDADPDKKRGAVKMLYNTNPDKKKNAVKMLYYANPDKNKMKSRIYYTQNNKARLEYFRKYRCCYRKTICHLRKARYNLTKPKPVMTGMYLRKIQADLLSDCEAKCHLKKVFHVDVFQHTRADLEKTVCKLAARKLVNISLQQRSNSAGTLLASIRSIKSLTLKEKGDFREGCHSASSEPYFYEAAYQPVQRDIPIPVNEYGHCIVAEKISSKKWKCSSECKPISEGEVNAILCLKAAFDMSVEEVRAVLTTCDYGCPFGHYNKQVGSTSVDLKGHPIVCYSGSECSSQLRILGAASNTSLC